MKLRGLRRTDPGCPQIPRRNRRGLIEAQCAPERLAILSLIPRRNRRGLIEAGQRQEPQDGGRRIPRRNRRGLIEADIGQLHRVGLTRFLGEIAEASLKQPQREQGGHPRSRFLGEIAEASLKPRRRAESQILLRGFLGEIAEASLKPPDNPCQPLCAEARFLGEIAEASLKPVDLVGPHGGRCAIPRRNRRGLIEARSTAAIAHNRYC